MLLISLFVVLVGFGAAGGAFVLRRNPKTDVNKNGAGVAVLGLLAASMVMVALFNGLLMFTGSMPTS